MKSLNEITWDDILGKNCTCTYKKFYIIIQNNYVTIKGLKTYKTFIIRYDTIQKIKDRIKTECK